VTLPENLSNFNVVRLVADGGEKNGIDIGEPAMGKNSDG
jgi:hypothetical protein